MSAKSPLEPVAQFPDKKHALKGSKNVKVGIANLGGCGGNNASISLSEWDPDVRQYLRVLVANTDGPHLAWLRETMQDDAICKKWLKSKRFLMMEIGDLGGKGTGANPEEGKKAMEMSMKKVESEFLSGLDSLIIVMGAGGGTGSGATPVLAKRALKLGITTLVFLTMPSIDEEGPRRFHRAVAARDEILKVAPTVTLYNAKVLSANPKLSAKKTWPIINSCVMLNQTSLQEICYNVGQWLNSDSADRKSVLREGNFVYSGYAEVGETFDLNQVIKDLFEDKWQDPRIIGKSTACQIWFHDTPEREWTNEERLSIASEASKRMGIDCLVKVDNEVHVGLYTGNDKKKWVAFIAVAKEDPESGLPALPEKKEVRANGPRMKSEEMVDGTRKWVTMDQELGEKYRRALQTLRVGNYNQSVLAELRALLPNLDARDLDTGTSVQIEIPAIFRTPIQS